MMHANVKELSRLLHDADPMGTCCNVNSDMEDEYDQIASTILEYAEHMSDSAAVEKAIVYWFDEYLFNRHKKELLHCIPSNEF
jgi:hypothetical protein